MTQPTALTPKLRFPEFQGSKPWNDIPIASILDVRDERQVPDTDTPLYSLTIEDGVTEKSDRYNREFLVRDSANKKYKVVRPDDVVYNPANLRWGAINFSRVPHPVVVSPIYEVLFIKNRSEACLEFVARALMRDAQIKRFITKAQGTLVERIAVKIDDFTATGLPVPPSPAEQQKIAECLSTLDELIGAESQKLDALKAHKKGLMQQLFPREGETLPRLRFPEFHSAPEWEEKKLGSVCDIQRGKFSHRPRNDPRFFGGPYPFIQTGDVVRSEGGAVVASQSLNEDGLAVSKLFKPTIVLITIAANIGDTGLLQTEGCFTDSVVGLIPQKDVIPVFLELVMRGQKENLNKVATTGAQKNINNEILREVSILLPSVPEQHRIATCLSSLDELIAAQSDRLSALQTHKQGLLQQLFPSPAESEQ